MVQPSRQVAIPPFSSTHHAPKADAGLIVCRCTGLAPTYGSVTQVHQTFSCEYFPQLYWLDCAQRRTLAAFLYMYTSRDEGSRTRSSAPPSRMNTDQSKDETFHYFFLRWGHSVLPIFASCRSVRAENFPHSKRLAAAYPDRHSASES
jgi:hypothetical protein